MKTPAGLRYYFHKRGKTFVLQYVDWTKPKGEKGPDGRRDVAYLWRHYETAGERDSAVETLDEHFRRERGLTGKDVLVSEFAKTWLGEITPNLRTKGARKVYEWAINKHVVPHWRTATLREITPGQVQAFIARLRTGTAEQKALAKKTVANIRATLHTMLEEAMKSHLIIPTNPAKYLGRSKALRLRPSKAERRAKIKALKAEQLSRFLKVDPTVVRPGFLLLFRTLAFTGMRPGEILAIQPGDFDFEERTAYISRAWSNSELAPPKGGPRTIDLGKETIGHLKTWIAQLKADMLAGRRPKSPYLFPSEAGTPIDHGYIEEAMKVVCKAAGLANHYTPHCLRHTYATLQLIAGVSIYYVQKQLGHETIEQTVDRYGSWLPPGNVANADALEAIVQKRKALREARRDDDGKANEG